MDDPNRVRKESERVWGTPQEKTPKTPKTKPKAPDLAAGKLAQEKLGAEPPQATDKLTLKKIADVQTQIHQLTAEKKKLEDKWNFRTGNLEDDSEDSDDEGLDPGIQGKIHDIEIKLEKLEEQKQAYISGKRILS